MTNAVGIHFISFRRSHWTCTRAASSPHLTVVVICIKIICLRYLRYPSPSSSLPRSPIFIDRTVWFYIIFEFIFSVPRMPPTHSVLGIQQYIHNNNNNNHNKWTSLTESKHLFFSNKFIELLPHDLLISFDPIISSSRAFLCVFTYIFNFSSDSINQ